MFTHQRISTNGVTLSVVQAGPPDGELVILLHGFPGFWYCWRSQIRHLAEQGYRVWAPDQRGYVLSDKPHELTAYGLDTLADDIIGLLDAAPSDRCILMGHDWGGAVAWWVALKYPDRLNKLIIVNSPHPRAFAAAIKQKAQRRKSAYMSLFRVHPLAEWVLGAGNFTALAWALRHTSKPGTFSASDIRAYKAAWAHPGALRGMLNWYRAMFAVRNQRVKRWPVQTPTLIIWGRADPVFLPELAAMSLEYCPAGELLTLDDARHWPMLAYPERVNQALDDFLRRAELP
ncbi:MAG: alpha/beta fold hydrolase [Anaerolineales bacterium]